MRVALPPVFCLVNSISSFSSQVPNHSSGKLSFIPHTGKLVLLHVPLQRICLLCNIHHSCDYLFYIHLHHTCVKFQQKKRIASLSFTSASAGLNNVGKYTHLGICEALNIGTKVGAYPVKEKQSQELACLSTTNKLILLQPRVRELKTEERGLKMRPETSSGT